MSSGITMKTPKDINLKADGNINLKATSNLAMKATADATLDGLSITHSAKTSFTAKGNASQNCQLQANHSKRSYGND